MGEYYRWVNVDKKEYLCPSEFDFGNKRHESLVRNNEFLRALRDLLSKEWAGDHVFWMGDEKRIPQDADNVTLRTLYDHTVQAGYPGEASDTIYEAYKNISGLFKAAKPEVRWEIEQYLEDLKDPEVKAYNEYGIDIKNPFDGLFLREGRNFLYTVNHTKKTCYSFEATKILYQSNEESDFVDPLPILLSYGNHADLGMWVGDIIGVSDEMPEGYHLLGSIKLDW